MRFLTTAATIPANGPMTLSSVQAVSRAIRTDNQGRRNYGILVNDGWITVYLQDGEMKLHQGAYVYVSPSGMIAVADQIDSALSAIDTF